MNAFSVRPDLDEHTCPQLNAIPTVGFSDPILSYFSALKLNFGGGHILKEGYEKVIHLPLNHIHLTCRTDDIPVYRQDQVYSKLPLFGDGW
jgi:hypothetical protein